MKIQRFLLIGFIFVSLLILAVGLTQAQEPAGGGKDSGGPLSAEAVVTTAFNYQGILKENGTAVTGSRDMVFKLQTDNTCAGPAVAVLTRNGVAVNNGFFNVSLDFNQYHFDGQALWLQVEVAGTDIGCQELTTVPYALSLRPGAIIRDSAGYILTVHNDGTGDGIRAYTNGDAHYDGAFYGTNTAMTGEGSGVYGQSNVGSGVYAQGYAADIAALRADNDNGPAAYTTAADSTYGVRLENTGSGDGLRTYSNSSTGAAWAAVFAYNTGTGSGVYGHSTGGYAGYFDGDINVTGSCIGCLLVYMGYNGGDTPLAVGDLVAVSGVEAPLAGTATPVLRLSAADATNTGAVLGIVQSAGELVSSDHEGTFSESVIRSGGPAAPGSYLFIAVQGLAQVKVNGPVAAGEQVSLANGVAGQAAEGSDAMIIGRAVEDTEQGGLIWVMVDFQ